MIKILVIDDEKSIRSSMKDILEYEGHEVVVAANGDEGLALVKSQHPDIIFCDIKMPGTEGIEVLERVKELSPATPVIMISGHGTIETAIDAIRKGAYDFMEKPFDLNRLLIAVRNATDKQRLLEETRVLRDKVNKRHEMIGNSPALQRVRDLIDKVAGTDARVLVTGPSGSGKELVARRLHALSHRATNNLVEVNCAAIPPELIESELFGHEKGAFTSAIRQKKGKFELAHGGTLFLDEIGDMSAGAQAKVLRALQEQTITRVGGDTDIRVDTRVIAATNKNLKKEIAAGNFREDLYHRLGVIIIDVPPLRERLDDIEPLARHFLAAICDDMGIATRDITPEAIRELQSGEWTGNIRELRNVIERLVILGGNPITGGDARLYR
ncbi:MAG: sigma-54 dependent transcriptional regulator [Odoribacteraceae bacterium]|nr:sigma-54 dependent transcriptional regulator [Odoribacteraceae bacterium]